MLAAHEGASAGVQQQQQQQQQQHMESAHGVSTHADACLFGRQNSAVAHTMMSGQQLLQGYIKQGSSSCQQEKAETCRKDAATMQERSPSNGMGGTYWLGYVLPSLPHTGLSNL
jgi:hypothetical protein